MSFDSAMSAAMTLTKQPLHPPFKEGDELQNEKGVTLARYQNWLQQFMVKDTGPKMSIFGPHMARTILGMADKQDHGPNHRHAGNSRQRRTFRRVRLQYRKKIEWLAQQPPETRMMFIL